jgi:hypothetical protein
MTSNSQPLRPEDRPTAVEIQNNMLRVMLHDGRIIATPLEWYPALAAATPEQQRHYELGVSGIHWPDIDEDLSVSGMLRGNRPPQPRQKTSIEG